MVQSGLRAVELFHVEASPYILQTAQPAIPKYPFTNNTPYMLMEGLTGHENDPNTRFVSNDTLEEFLHWCSSDVGVMVSVSGIGKTRTIIEALSVRYGLYFAVDTHGNGGIYVSIILACCDVLCGVNQTC